MFSKTLSRGYFRKGFPGYFRGSVPIISAPGKVAGACQTATLVATIKTAQLTADTETGQLVVKLEILQEAP
jgi:hypothetical protein